MPPLDRRRFGKLIALGMGASVLPAEACDDFPATKLRLIKPPRLRPGDTVGLITPSGHVDQDKIDTCVGNLKSLDFKVRLGRNIRALRGNFAGTTQQRLEDFHAMFADPEVRGIWAAHGGSGAISMLASLDYELIRRNPKVFVGYSDITALHLAILRRAGLVTFHGPVASSTFSEYSVSHLRAVLMLPQPEFAISMAAENRLKALDSPHFSLRTLRSGMAEGTLVGGNLSLLSALVGTPYAADFNRAIVFLEEISEAPYRIDRMLTQLELSQGFRQAAAVMLGVFEKCGPPDSDPSLSLDETIDDHLANSIIPSVYGYSFGHIAHQFTLPMGLKARLDTEKQTLTLLEPAVV
ncbi:MAG: LD-carboxypeptidase [Rhodocyclaceae bacterium]|nr:MAG: LD-carboxypeptidase [Rhodocyclaceae bacterium]